MSFWSHSPGPFWSHFFQSLLSCSDQDRYILNQFLERSPREISLPPGLVSVELSSEHAGDMEKLLYSHYKSFPRSQIVLSKKRIQDGFHFDGWIGVGIYYGAALVGCAISRDLGRMHIAADSLSRVGMVDFFCVAEEWRKKKLASYLLQELVILTAKQKRIVHFFQKEGLPLSPLPPIWQSHYIWRKRVSSHEYAEHLGKEGIATRSEVRIFNYASQIPYEGCLATVPNQLTGDSELYSFCYKGYSLNLCITNTFHISVPEKWRIGEILWILPNDKTVPQEIQELAVETLVDNCKYDMVLMDASIPHNKYRSWQKDSPYGYYIFNYNPTHFFSLKPYFVF